MSEAGDSNRGIEEKKRKESTQSIFFYLLDLEIVYIDGI